MCLSLCKITGISYSSRAHKFTAGFMLSWVYVAHLFSFLRLIHLFIFCFRSVSCGHCYLCLWVVHCWWPLWFSLTFINDQARDMFFYRFIANYILTNTITLILLVSMSKLPCRDINFTGTLFHFLLSTIFVRKRFVLVCMATKTFHLACLVDTFNM